MIVTARQVVKGSRRQETAPDLELGALLDPRPDPRPDRPTGHNLSRLCSVDVLLSAGRPLRPRDVRGVRGNHDISFSSYPRRAQKLVTEWAKDHQEELRQNWNLAREHKPPCPIDPLG